MSLGADNRRFTDRDVAQHADHTYLGGRGRTGSEEGFDPNLTRTESSVPLTNSLAAAGDGVDPGEGESGFRPYPGHINPRVPSRVTGNPHHTFTEVDPTQAPAGGVDPANPNSDSNPYVPGGSDGDSVSSSRTDPSHPYPIGSQVGMPLPQAPATRSPSGSAMRRTSSYGSLGSLGEDANPILGPSVARPSSMTIGPSIDRTPPHNPTTPTSETHGLASRTPYDHGYGEDTDPFVRTAASHVPPPPRTPSVSPCGEEAPARPGPPRDANPNAAMDDKHNQLMLNARQLALNVNVVNFGHTCRRFWAIISIVLVAAVLAIWSPCTIGFHVGLVCRTSWCPEECELQQHINDVSEQHIDLDTSGRCRDVLAVIDNNDTTKIHGSTPETGLQALRASYRRDFPIDLQHLGALGNETGLHATASSNVDAGVLKVSADVCWVAVVRGKAEVAVYVKSRKEEYYLQSMEVEPTPLTVLTLSEYWELAGNAAARRQKLAERLSQHVDVMVDRRDVRSRNQLRKHCRRWCRSGNWTLCDPPVFQHMAIEATAGYNPAFANHQQRLASIDNTQRSFDPKEQPPCHAFYTSEPSKPSSPPVALLTLDGVNRIHQQYPVRLLEQLENVHGMWANASATLPREESSENRTFLVGETVAVVGIPEAGGKVKVHQWHSTQRFKLVEPELIPQPLTPLSLATYLAHDDAMSAKKELDADEEAHRKWIDAVHNAENKNEQRARCHSLCQTGTLSVCALPLWETTKETARRELRTFEGLESTVQQVVRATERSLELAIKHFRQVSTTKEHCLKWFNLENSTTPTTERLLLSLKSAQRKLRYLSSELKKAGHSASEIEQLCEDISHLDRNHVAVRKVSSVDGRKSAVAMWFYIERIGDDYWYISSTAWQEYKRRPAPPEPLVECEPDSCSCSWWEWMLWRCSRVHNACRRRCEKEKQAYNAQLAKRNEWSGCDDAHPVEVANSLRMSRCLEEHRDAPELQSAAREEVYERKARMIADQGTREMTLRHA